MEGIELRKEQNLQRIYNARDVINQALISGLITSNDIFKLLRCDKEYVLSSPKSYKELLLKQIAINPFLLCDQDNLDLNVKKIIPVLLTLRSNSEIDELEMMQELDFISEQELKEEIQMVKFNYYLSSEDGRNILKKGHVKNVKDKVLRKTIK